MKFLKACCLCWMRLLPAGCRNAQRHFGRHSLPLLLKALTPLWAKSQSQLFLKAAGLVQVALGVISSFTPFMLRHSRKLAACDGCVFSPLAPRPCVSMLFKAILVGKISFVTVFESSWSPSSGFGGNPAVHSLHAMLRNSRDLAACAGCVFSPLAPRLCRSRSCA